ncbi:MAG: beta-ketoacyl synthase N-terminal-like domain-containing protein [Candidatus Levybacteria bacterium]|nr:beta-ketoacyl synthase N-terminal-like domain-containing protein [Candidatus Levybacteria bacterium]
MGREGVETGRIRPPKHFHGHRLVVTAMEDITALGQDKETTWKNLIAGKCGIREVDYKIDEKTGRSTGPRVAGEIFDWNPAIDFKGVITSKDVLNNSKSVVLSTAATGRVLQEGNLLDSNFKFKDTVDTTRAGFVIGTGGGGEMNVGELDKRTLEDKPTRPSDLKKIQTERVSSVPSMKFGSDDENKPRPVRVVATPLAACAAGNAAICFAAQQIILDRCDFVVTGGSESILEDEKSRVRYIPIVAFDGVRALSQAKSADEVKGPFDAFSDGFNLGDGVGILLLEDYDFAKKRGASMYAELVGYGSSGDAFNDTFPDKNGIGQMLAMKEAMTMAKISKKERVFVCAHATGTLADRIEAWVIAKMFKDYNLVGVTSIKGATAHTIGGAGAIEAIASIQTLMYGIMPPTIKNYNPIPEISGLPVVRNEAKLMDVDVVVNSSFGFGGHNYVTVFRLVK